jgi:CheY-like chemotaxis protein
MKKILIIDDDQFISNIYRNKLAVDNYQVEVATDGEAGLAMVKSFAPDAVILDLMLPKLAGLEVLKSIRALEGFKQLPVIVFSNTYLSNLVQDAWKAGATKCLSKASATPKQVLDVVRSLTAKSVPVAAIVPTPTDLDVETSFQVNLQQSFLTSAPASLTSCRAQLQAIAKSSDDASRTKSLLELYRLTHTFTANAGIAGALCVAQFSDALEALLKELCDKSSNINASTLRTVALALDFLGQLVQQGASLEASVANPEKPGILVLDDEAISRRAVTHALEKAKLPCLAVEAPAEALKLLNESAFDVVFLDVDMPGMTGYEVCTKLRATPLNKTTPVVFVTGLSDFESRANSIMSGGNDLIAKPFLFMELAVKALVYVLRSRLQAANSSALPSANLALNKKVE